jgi:hypothetical protein
LHRNAPGTVDGSVPSLAEALSMLDGAELAFMNVLLGQDLVKRESCNA